MKTEQDYIQDLAQIRSMMERSSKFLSLSGWAGVMAGIYALAGAYIAWKFFQFTAGDTVSGTASADLPKIMMLAIIVLVLALGTAILLSSKNANAKGEKSWNATSRRLLVNMAVPLCAGGILILVLLSKGLVGMIIPVSLIFYGLALFNAGKFTFDEIKFLGLLQIVLGLLSAYFIQYSLLLWALGFGVLNMVYGIYIHYKYER
jgi:hypothetical protein